MLDGVQMFPESATNSMSDSPMHFAAHYGNLDVIKLLVIRGSNVNARDVFLRYSPLHWASEYGHSKVVKYLLKHGAIVDMRYVIHLLIIRRTFAKNDSIGF